MQTAGPTSAKIISLLKGTGPAAGAETKGRNEWGAMRYFRLPPSHLAKMGGSGALTCPGWVSKVFVGYCHQLFDASHGGSNQRLVRPLGNTLCTEDQDGQTPGKEELSPTSPRTVIVLVGEFTKPPVVLAGFRVVRCRGRKPRLGMWLWRLFPQRKTAAAQCTGQRRVVRPQGESPGCELTAVADCHWVAKSLPPPPIPLPLYKPPRRPKWSHTGFPLPHSGLVRGSSD